MERERERVGVFLLEPADLRELTLPQDWSFLAAWVHDVLERLDPLERVDPLDRLDPLERLEPTELRDPIEETDPERLRAGLLERLRDGLFESLPPLRPRPIRFCELERDPAREPDRERERERERERVRLRPGPPPHEPPVGFPKP